MDDMLMAECGGDMDGAHMPALTADLVKPRSKRRNVRHAARICTGGCSCAARRAVLLATVLLLNALFRLTLSYAALYRPLERAIQVECGARADYHVLVYGGKTGTTEDAGACLVLLSRDLYGTPYLSVIFHSENHETLYSEMNEILSLIPN